MKKVILKAALALSMLAFGIVMSCSKDDESKPETKVTNKQVIENYAKIVHQNYLDSYSSAVEMQSKINTFIATPSEANLDAAKTAWIAARDIYGLSEVFRGSGGPIDTEDDSANWTINNEGQLNAWPLNEAYIDYVAEKTSYTGTYDVSIIGGDETITKELLIGKNQPSDAEEKAVSTGWHAIEFLLWGQDNTVPADKKAGQRAFTDYTTADNADRRKEFLKVVTNLLVEDLKSLSDTWNVGGTYYNVFTSLSEKEALNNILNGTYFLASFELSNERMLGPATSSDGIGESGQEDEHSCFSDNTHRDVYTNAKGISNVLLGEYGNIKGASPYDLIKQVNEAQAEKLKSEIETMMTAITAIDSKAKAGTPFDLMITQEGETNPGIVLAGNSALKKLGDVIKESANKLQITTVNGEE